MNAEQVVKLSQSVAFKKVKFQNCLQWSNDCQQVVKLSQSGAFQKVKFQNFLQPWWSNDCQKVVILSQSDNLGLNVWKSQERFSYIPDKIIYVQYKLVMYDE